MRLSLVALALVCALPALRGEEGMWTFDNLPLKAMKEKYAFEPSSAWIDHLRLSTLTLGGCTGSFISADGLVLTNHHCARGMISRLSSKERDLVKQGFVAASKDQELKIQGATWRTLMTMENVTERLAKAVKKGMGEKEAAKVRAQELELIKEELEKKTGLSFDPVRLYQGGETWMYGYKVFKDIRLVAAPEIGVAMFGGDYDNFTYPRHNLDFTLLRVYENDKPYHPPHHLTWSQDGLKLGDLTFVVGHPGRTSRMQTYAQMRYDRDFGLPERIRSSERTLAILQEYADRGPEQARLVQTTILGVNNGLKANGGALQGLKDAQAMKRLEDAEKALKAEVAKRPELAASTGNSWAKIEEAIALQKKYSKDAQYVGAARSTVLAQALALTRFIQQKELPVDKRLSDYRSEEQLSVLRTRLLGPATGMMGATAAQDQEVLMFTRGLGDAQKELGPQHAYVKAVLGSETPEKVAKSVLEATKLRDVEVRKALLEGGSKALQASDDPMIRLALKIEPLLLGLRDRQDTVKALIDEHGARIARARFAVYGKTLPPDATSTLRLTYGPVATYPANGTMTQPFTTYLGLYDRHLGWGGNETKAFHGEWTLPQRWLDRMDKVNLKTPFNFIHAVDTTGGNSGSPVVNRKGELVGLLFDGNIEGNAGSYYYDEKVNRSVSVDARAILEALAKVYDAPHLVSEILGK
ncbi:MAG: S46 family peptidase [Firmicutes bacterium]|nr:S46 family peptidase [Bacillota bacterium]